jgi:hypothetical protein
MSHQRIADIETRKGQAERKLAARLEVLKARGLEESKIQKDATVRQIRAAIRHARRQMERIAEFEALDRQKAESKEQKRKAPKELKPKVKKAQQGESRRKAKREKKASLQGKGDERE